jgi:hypothetical protein
MAPPVSGSTPIAHPLWAASAPATSSVGSSEREASQGSRGSASARSFARALALARDRGVRAAAAGAGSRRQRQRQRRGRKGGEKKEAAAVDQCGAERRRTAVRSAFMGSWLATAADAAPAAAAAAAIIRRAAAGLEGEEGFACSAAGDKASPLARHSGIRVSYRCAIIKSL